MKKLNTETGEHSGASLCSAYISAIEEIGREVQLHPNDSVVDIINDALISFNLPFFAEWTEDDLDPVKIKPNVEVTGSLPCGGSGKQGKGSSHE
jgi:hypothetical protein